MSQTNDNLFAALSGAMAEAVAKGAAATVMVDARRRRPASGIGISESLVLTADHVVEREEEIRIYLADGSERSAALSGRDPGSDLAVLRVDGAGLVKATRAENEARLGQFALAIGRPSIEGAQASLGIISAIGGSVRTGRGSLLEGYIRSDAIPYPGFSGGPLVDSAGDVLGINTPGLWQGGSVTIPARVAWAIGETLATDGKVKRGYLGIRSQPVELPAALRQAVGREQKGGLLVVGVEADGPAGQSGLLMGDILVSLAGAPVNDPDELATHLVGSVVGKPATVEVLRGGQPLELTVKIGERK